MKLKQQQEINTLNKIIEDSLSLSKWDGINDWAKGKYANDKVLYVEWSVKRINPEQVYFQINGWWVKWLETGDISEKIRVNKLLKAKEHYDLAMSTWIQDVKSWLLSINELKDDWFWKEAQIIYNKLKNEKQLPAWIIWDFHKYAWFNI